MLILKGFLLKRRASAFVWTYQDRKDMGWAITEQEQVEDMGYIREIEHPPFG